MRILNLIRRFPLNRIRYQAYCSSPPSDAPVKYTTSKASAWKAEYSRRGAAIEDDEEAWFQPYVIVTSLSVFLIYFCVLREENDVDHLLGTSLYDRIEGLEELQLKNALKYNFEHGLPTKDIVARLNELEATKKYKVEAEEQR